MYGGIKDPLNCMKRDGPDCTYVPIAGKKQIGGERMPEEHMSTEVNDWISSWWSRCAPPNMVVAALSCVSCWGRSLLLARLVQELSPDLLSSYLEVVTLKTRTLPSGPSVPLFSLPRTNIESPGFISKKPVNMSIWVHDYERDEFAPFCLSALRMRCSCPSFGIIICTGLTRALAASTNIRYAFVPVSTELLSPCSL